VDCAGKDMKNWEYDAVIVDGSIYCVECAPCKGTPIFAGDEWDYAPVCEACGFAHTYMSILEPVLDEPVLDEAESILDESVQ